MNPMASNPRVRVAALIQDEDNVLMVCHEKDGQRYWMLPGGGVDHGETLAEALERELREELCIGVEATELVLVNDSIAHDGSRHIINICFRAELIDDNDPALGSDGRIVDFAWQPVSELSSLSMRPDYGEPLRALLEEYRPDPEVYLGNIWKDQ